MLDSRCLVVEFHFCMFLFKRVLDNFLLSDSAGFFISFFVWLIDIHVQKLTVILKQTCARSICALIQLLSEAVLSLKNCDKHVPHLVNCHFNWHFLFFM